MKGEFDPCVFGPLGASLKPGGAFIDVGANIGYYSLLAIDKVGSNGQVHAFEIDARPLRCLRRTVGTAGLTNLRVHEVAVGNYDGSAKLFLRPDSGHSSVSPNGTGMSVPILRLDTWWASTGVKSIQAMKLDIEGGELWALQGAEKLLREERPLLVCEAAAELAERVRGRQGDVLRFLEKLGYIIQWLEGAWTPTIVARPQ